jgi:general L-amino acid transport system permease protein
MAQFQGEDPIVLEDDAPPDHSLPPGEWVKKNLFSTWYNTLITVVVALVAFFAIRGAINWILDTDFEIIRANLRLFMVGQFDREELWRPAVALLVLAFAIGFVSGAAGRNAYEDALEKGLPANRSTWPGLIRRFWAVIAVVVFFVSFARTATPYLLVAGAFVLVVLGRELGWRASPYVRFRLSYIGALLVLTGIAVIAGPGGLAAALYGLIIGLWVASEIGKRDILPAGVAGAILRWGVPLIAAVVVYFVANSLPLEGRGWDEWGGLQLTLFVTVIGIAAGMPLGILLALGRRSELPVIRGFSVLFIEFIRGVPLISLLLFSNLMLRLFFPIDVGIPSDLTMAMIVITGFSAAYIAEIVRGGLQAVPKGQTEAAQAMGLSPGRVQRLIVLPQALRAVIPAMVGQFIALFKDTSLLAIIGIAEFLRISDIANAQPDFQGKLLATVTYVFVAIGYWAFAYTMSKEARRLETRLGVGTR